MVLAVNTANPHHASSRFPFTSVSHFCPLFFLLSKGMLVGESQGLKRKKKKRRGESEEKGGDVIHADFIIAKDEVSVKAKVALCVRRHTI